jgi:exopolysaccharide production protein ExoZ
MFFYALLALSLILRPRHVGILTGVLGLLVAAGATFPGGPLAWTVYTDPILLEFAAGLWIGWAWDKGFRLPAPAGAVLLALCVLAIGMSYGHPVWEGRWLRPLAWGLPALGIVLGVLALEGTGPMASRIGLLLGAASYAIYLVHPLVLVVLGRAWLVGQVTSPVVIVGVSLLASIAAGVLCHLALERPLVRASRTLLGLGGRTRPAELLPRARCGAAQPSRLVSTSTVSLSKRAACQVSGGKWNRLPGPKGREPCSVSSVPRPSTTCTNCS